MWTICDKHPINIMSTKQGRRMHPIETLIIKQTKWHRHYQTGTKRIRQGNNNNNKLYVSKKHYPTKCV